MIKTILRASVRSLGFEITRLRPELSLKSQPEYSEVMSRIAAFTMTSPARQAALIDAVRYVVRGDTPGCFVECGVWRGGSSMAIALTLLQEQATDRDLYLYDTFEGMTAPTDVDVSRNGMRAVEELARTAKRKWSDTSIWCAADYADVHRNMHSTCYPSRRLHLIKGPVEETIPKHSPTEPIALLRLDTDWYQSTRHELEHLFPRLISGGVLILDDYGYWSGAKKAVDEYLASLSMTHYLHRIDHSGRILIKR